MTECEICHKEIANDEECIVVVPGKLYHAKCLWPKEEDIRRDNDDVVFLSLLRKE